MPTIPNLPEDEFPDEDFKEDLGLLERFHRHVDRNESTYTFLVTVLIIMGIAFVLMYLIAFT